MDTGVAAVLFDVDGTLVDSNDAHATAWIKAFNEFGIAVDPVLVRRCIGMGGDKLMPRVSGLQEESTVGAQIARRRGEIFRTQLLPGLKPFPGAEQLVEATVARGFRAVAASSASKKDLLPLLEIAGAKSLLDDWTSSDDADESKPSPDIVDAALARAKVPASAAVLIGDTPYDIAAGRSAGVRVIAFRCGGWLDPDLVGAIEIYAGPWELVQKLDRSLLSGLRDVGSEH
ncbi:MAG TPA: HAD family hydrolase [Vicinamibacterales bacterium]|nr:HAD family hydrolase [Vicinamibacterales bacterium]